MVGIAEESPRHRLLPSLLEYQLTAPALALLLVFRTEASYARFDEGRKAWMRVLAGAETPAPAPVRLSRAAPERPDPASRNLPRLPCPRRHLWPSSGKALAARWRRGALLRVGSGRPGFGALFRLLRLGGWPDGGGTRRRGAAAACGGSSGGLLRRGWWGLSGGGPRWVLAVAAGVAASGSTSGGSGGVAALVQCSCQHGAG
ncbi:hypothetical protein QYE76_035101 [Lolium multiflorum]|uniref:Uncharacterized protein n=1 Tax=Lolium multiflorum TaxID=4521 RepID=A0AAD8R2A2_LOLMU|nr:hypothetical protein QYE76_035101 [Lolium multiflorum]